MATVKDPLEQANQITKIAGNIAKRVNDCSLETINEFLTISNKHLKSAGTSKNMDELMNMANDMGAAYVNCSQRALNVALENFSDYSKWLESLTQNINPLGAMKSFTDRAARATDK